MSNNLRHTYRAHFRPNGHYTLNEGSFIGNSLQHPYCEQPIYGVKMYDQNQPPSLPSVPFVNAYSLTTNTHGVPASTARSDFNGLPYMGYSDQANHNGLRQLAVPPLPAPSSTASYAAQSFHQTPTSLELTPFISATIPKPSDTHGDSRGPECDVENANHTAPASSDLEDGELNDEALQAPIDQSTAISRTDSRIMYHQQPQNADSVVGKSRKSNATLHKPLPGLAQGSNAPIQQPTPISSESQQLLAQRDPVIASNYSLPSTSGYLKTNAGRSTNGDDLDRRETRSDFMERRKNEARKALRDLLSHGLEITQLADEGLNPDVLHQLCTDVSIPIKPYPGLQQQMVEPRFGAKHPSIERAPNAIALGEETPHSIPTSNAPNSHKSLTLIPEAIRHINNSSTATTRGEKESVSTPVATPPRLKKTSSVGIFGKPSGAKNSDTKILDRKEYIARMLAARAGKSGANSNVPVTSKASTVTTPSAIPPHQSASGAGTNMGPLTSQPAVSMSSDASSQLRREDADLETKRKAQTDLARQKIEALRYRQNNQMEAPSILSNLETNDIGLPQAERLPNFSVENRVSVPPPLMPSRQSSYFSPASQKPPFSIPGLSLASDALGSPKHSSQFPSQASVSSPQMEAHISHRSTQQEPHLISTKPSNITPVCMPEGPSCTTTTTVSAVSGMAPSSHRERQKAADFIDLPSTGVKRPLGQQENTSVIIDISEDEINSTSSENDSLDVDIASPGGTRSKELRTVASSNGTDRSNKSLPPLTNFRPRKKPAIMTPSAVSQPGQGGNTKGLRSKEMEIVLMNRKIAELEQRIAIKAKQTTSRTQSPGTSSRVTVSPTPNERLQNNKEQPNCVIDSRGEREGDVEHLEIPKPSRATSENAETSSAAEQKLEAAELEKAEAERSLALKVSPASTGDLPLASQILMLNPHDNEQSVLSKEQQQLPYEEQNQTSSEEVKWLQSEERIRLQRIEQNRSDSKQCQRALEEESKGPVHEEGRDQAQPQERAQKPSHRVRSSCLEEEEMESSDEQRRARTAEIESGLRLLDAEVESTRERLEHLRREIANLEIKVQKGVKKRQMLTEELLVLSQSKDTPQVPNEHSDVGQEDAVERPSKRGEIQAVTDSSRSSEMLHESDTMRNQDIASVIEDRLQQSQVAPSPQALEEQMSEGEFEEDLMDISRSDVDQEEILPHGPKSLIKAQTTADAVDDEEIYKPPSDVNTTARPETDYYDTRTDQNGQGLCAGGSPVPKTLSTANEDAESIEEGARAVESSLGHTCTQVDKQTSQLSPVVADNSDPDEYEPPEPGSFKQEKSTPPILDVDLDSSFSPPDVAIGDNIVPMSLAIVPGRPNLTNYNATTVETNLQTGGETTESGQTRGHFTPYESPLKQFKSFRYHPEYLNEVSNGFRSLTYSHTINPDIPLCRYELGGICNDSSCQSQHFRSMSLSDDKILVDLGAKPEGSSGPETEAFGNGLRQIIHDIRSRKVKDFNIVASEITAYRARFLGDSSKVLPL